MTVVGKQRRPVRPRRKALVEEEGDIRPKNQVTLPKRIAEALGVSPGDGLVFVDDEDQTDELRVYCVPRSFAGIAPHAYGGPQSGTAYVRAERKAWEE